jgi:hypothetical protein
MESRLCRDFAGGVAFCFNETDGISKNHGIRELQSREEWRVSTIIPLNVIEQKIFRIRGENVILDEDLADLYEVETKKLIQAVKRNIVRFPADFMFQLTNQEVRDLRSQIVTSSQWGGRR